MFSKAQEMNKKPSLILYDLDGTLVDTISDITSAINKTFSETGFPSVSSEVVKQSISKGTYRMIDGMFESFISNKKVGAVLPSDFSIETLHERFNSHYMNNLADCSFVYPGVTEFLSCVSDMGIFQAVVTNKPESFASKLVDQLGLDSFFYAVVSTEKMKAKPDPEALLHVGRSIGIAAGNTLMIGDTAQDIAAARAANILSVAVTYGYSRKTSLVKCRPDFIVDNLNDLLAFMPLHDCGENHVNTAL
jgi:phosphoglycolate phosphatase